MCNSWILHELQLLNFSCVEIQRDTLLGGKIYDPVRHAQAHVLRASRHARPIRQRVTAHLNVLKSSLIFSLCDKENKSHFLHSISHSPNTDFGHINIQTSPPHGGEQNFTRTSLNRKVGPTHLLTQTWQKLVFIQHLFLSIF